MREHGRIAGGNLLAYALTQQRCYLLVRPVSVDQLQRRVEQRCELDHLPVRAPNEEWCLAVSRVEHPAEQLDALSANRHALDRACVGT
jgi:hypothetical protein